MALIAANLVHQTATTTGTGNFTLAAVSGKQSFNTAFGNGVTTNVFYYFISHRAATEWEIGTGHMSDATTLVRDTVILSTNANAAVNFAAGTKDVTNDIPVGTTIHFHDGNGIASSETNNPSILTFTSVASAVNYISISNSATGVKPIIATAGTDASIGLEFRAKSDGTFVFSSEGLDNEILGAFQVNATSSSAGVQDGFGAAIEFKLENEAGDDGFDAGKLSVYTHDIAAELGTFQITLSDGAGDTVLALDVVGVAAATNYLTITNAATGGAPRLEPAGDLDGIAIGASFFEITEMTAPSTGPANTARLFTRDNGGGKTQVCVIFQSGAVQVIATEV
jgi:hypothetical protein